MANKPTNPSNDQQNRGSNQADRNDQNRSGKQNPGSGSMDQSEQRRTAGKESSDTGQSSRNREESGRNDR